MSADRPPAEERRYPSTLGGLCYLALLGLAVAGVVIAAFGSWRPGVYCLAASLVAASVLRLVLPARDAGMLAVRSRTLDCVLLAALGIALAALTAGLPDPS